MINKFIVNAVLKQAKTEDKDNVLKMIIEKFDNEYYNDNKAIHILEMLVNPASIVKKEDINIDFIINNLKKFIFGLDNLIVEDVNIISIDNINGHVELSYKYKHNFDKEDVEFKSSNFNASFIDYPEMLKKS